MADKKSVSYAEAMNEIEQIIRSMQDEQTDIDTLAQRVKRATELISECKKKLLKAEADVNKSLSE